VSDLFLFRRWYDSVIPLTKAQEFKPRVEKVSFPVAVIGADAPLSVSFGYALSGLVLAIPSQLHL